MRLRVRSLALLSGLDPTLLRLWHRPTAIAPVRLLAWEPPHAAGAALEKGKKTKKKKKKKKNFLFTLCSRMSLKALELTSIVYQIYYLNHLKTPLFLVIWSRIEAVSKMFSLFNGYSLFFVLYLIFNMFSTGKSQSN